MPGPIAVLDTDVLVPIVACDFLLTAFDHGLYEPILAITTLAEIERTLIQDFSHLDPAAIRHRVATMQLALEDQLVDGQAVEVPAGINPKDRHIIGAAVVAAAQVIVTNDRRLRAEVEASELEQAALDLDTFAVMLWHSSPTDVRAVIDTMVAKRQRRPVSTDELTQALHRDMPSLATALRTT